MFVTIDNIGNQTRVFQGVDLIPKSYTVHYIFKILGEVLFDIFFKMTNLHPVGYWYVSCVSIFFLPVVFISFYFNFY